MKRLFEQSWVWALLGTLVLWTLLSAGSGQVSIGSLSGILASAAVLCVVAIGQMLVVTTGDGAVDLSIPNVMTLSGFLATSVISGNDGQLISGLAVVVLLGSTVGILNALTINHLRIPPIITTLAVGYILTTGTLIFNRGFRTYAVSPLLVSLASTRIADIPVLLILALVASFLAYLVLHRTVYGRSLAAIGQNSEAAYLAGVRVKTTRLVAYVISGVLAALGGVLLSARVGGAFLEMGNPFLLQSVGAVVVGGSSILGGKATAL
ncbi:MAG: ribose transport system permease protein, partial [Verrucomicrobiota bacterium]|nr:ribose transport system permease protein [Verrucomicrobiota bacterium]